MRLVRCLKAFQCNANVDRVGGNALFKAVSLERSGSMKCPIDGSDLMMTERQGIEIDYCPKCRGIWLDRGELDKLIERSASAAPPQPVVAPQQPHDYYAPTQEYERGQQHDPRYKNKKKKSFLGDIFDF
jgi:Zn-finger nucleic acid-binding protein